MGEREDFTAKFRDATEGMTTAQVAKVCRCSLKTVEKWQSGVIVPHRVARPSVFAALAKFKEYL